MEWESRFTLGVNAAINTDYIKNVSNNNCLQFNFRQRPKVCVYVYLYQEWRGRGLQTFGMVISSKVLFEYKLKPLAPLLGEIDMDPLSFW